MKEPACLGVVFCLAVLIHSVAHAQTVQPEKDGVYFAAASGQTETDEYTRYELLEPETASFKIYYEVAAASAGAK